MTANLVPQWEWSFSTKAPMLHLHQADQTGHVALSDEEGGVYLLSPQGKLLLELGFSRPVRSVRVVCEGQRLIVLDHSGCLYAFNPRGEKLWKTQTDPFALSMDAWVEGQGIAVGCTSGLVILYNSRGQKLRAAYLQHPLVYLKFALRSHGLLGASNDGRLSYLDPRFKFSWMGNIRTACGGIDVDESASLMLLTAYSEGAYAFNAQGETIGAFEIDGAIYSCALCQKGERILVTNQAGRLHVLRRDGNLETFLDFEQEVPRMDLNYEGDCVALQLGRSQVRALRWVKGNGHRPAHLEVKTEALTPRPTVEQRIWQDTFPGGGEGGEIRLTANGSFCVGLSANHVLCVWSQEGKRLWQETVDPAQAYRLFVARASNTILLVARDYVEYFTCTEGRIQRIPIRAQLASVHDAGLSFAICTFDSKLCFFDKNGHSVWSKILGYAVTDIQVSPLGSAVFVAGGDGHLRAFVREGKVGWDKKVQSEGEYTHPQAKVLSQAIQYRDRIVCPAARFVLDRQGITLGTQEGEVFRLNAKGERVWGIRFEEPVVGVRYLREFAWITLRSGRDQIVDQAGKVVETREKFSGLRRFVIASNQHLLVLEAESERMTGEDLTTKEKVFTMNTQKRITQLEVELTGNRFALVAGGEVQCFHLLDKPKTVAETVSFLEI